MCGPSIPDDADEEELRWAIMYALLRANTRTNQTIEEFYYHFHYRCRGDAGPLFESLERAIARQEVVREDLQSAHAMLEELAEAEDASGR